MEGGGGGGWCRTDKTKPGSLGVEKQFSSQILNQPHLSVPENRAGRKKKWIRVEKMSGSGQTNLRRYNATNTCASVHTCIH